jgi:membrane associated rhomboid family serine protease
MHDTYRAPTRFAVFPPVIKNLLILNGLFYMAQFAAGTAPGGLLSVVLSKMALWPLGHGYFWPWQLVTYAFLHDPSGLGHIFFNMFALWMFGVQLENAWGSQRFAIYYFVSVIGAGLIQLLVASLSGGLYPTIGASGGVFGILLAFGMMYPNTTIMLIIPPIPIKAKYFVIGYGALSLFLGVTGMQAGVAHFAHLGGMIFGFLLIMYWRGKLPVKPDRVMHW